MAVKDLVIVIPTRGRVGKQVSFSGLTGALRRRTVIVCPQKEVAAHKGNHPQAMDVIAQPDPEWTISRKRRWIVEELAGKRAWARIVMLDDDLRWCVRREDDRKKFLTAKPEEVDYYFGELEEQLTPTTPHAGFSARGGNLSPKGQLGGWQRAKRAMYVLGYHVPTLLANCEPFRIETREDMDTCLQLLRKGFPNVVSYTFVCDQVFNAEGGASLERDFERSNRDAHLLAELHPGLIRLVEKQYEVSVPRTEVVVQWERALQEGEQWRASKSAGAKAGAKRSRRG